MNAFTPDGAHDITPDEDDFECRKCGEPVEHGIQRCPDCGYKALGYRISTDYRAKMFHISVLGCYISIVCIPLAKYPKKWRDAWAARRDLGVAEPVGDSSGSASAPASPGDQYDHYTDVVDDVKELKREERHDEAERILQWCLDQNEAEAEGGGGVGAIAPWYYKHLAIIYRKDDRHRDEIAVLEQYVAACETAGQPPDEELVERLERARELVSA